MKNTKLALYTVCDDGFVPVCKVLFRSFFESNGWFQGDVVVVYEPTHCSLSKESMALLAEVIPADNNLLFHEASFSDYEKLFSSILAVAPSRRLRTLSCIFKWELFRNSRYDKAVYLDADMLVLNNISNLFVDNHPFTGVSAPKVKKIRLNDLERGCGEYAPGDKMMDEINGGMYSVSSEFCSEELFQKLIAFCESLDFRKLYKRIGKGRVGEQSMLSLFMEQYDRTIISMVYNMTRRCLTDKDLKKSPDLLGIFYILHYTGQKPLEGVYKYRVRGVWRNCKITHDLWMSYHD
jgi:hypothetical protein